MLCIYAVWESPLERFLLDNIHKPMTMEALFTLFPDAKGTYKIRENPSYDGLSFWAEVDNRLVAIG